MIFLYFGGIMIKCHLSEVMGKKKLKISDLARETGLHRNTITLLYKEEATRVELDAMEKLCIYFDCSVGELFEYVPDEPQKPNEG
jgi:putative transcriptional regulator